VSVMSPPLVGVQTPRIMSQPPRVGTLGGEAADLAAQAGLVLDPWQRLVVDGAFGIQSDGRWSAFEVAVVVPRQSGKGSILEAIELAGLFLFDEELIIHSAHEFKTAVVAFNRVVSLINANDWLRRQVRRVRTSHGDEGIELNNGHALRFMARTKGAGRGFTGDRIILDEAYNLGPESMAALLPTLSSRPNPQLVYASSAGMATSLQLQAVRERGKSGTDRSLAYFEWSAPDDCDPEDRANWAQSNPALGIRISEEFIGREKAAMPAPEFARERLGIWDDGYRGSVISAEDWRACLDPTSRIEGPPRFAVDVRPDRSAAAIGAAGRRADGLWHVETVDAQSGTSWVVPRLVQLLERWGSAPVGIDPGGPAAPLMTAMLAAGLEVAATSTQEMTQASGLFFDRVTDRSLRHVPQASLDAAVAAGQRKWLGDKWLWARKEAVDVTPLLACSVALFVAQQAAVERPRTNKAAFY